MAMAYRALRRQHYLRRLVTGEASCLAGNLKRANKRKVGAIPELASVETSIRYPCTLVPACAAEDLVGPSTHRPRRFLLKDRRLDLIARLGMCYSVSPAYSGGVPGTRK